jgi:hypothetical protein
MKKLRYNTLSSDEHIEKHQTKEQSMNKLRLWCSGLLIASVGLWLTGCATICCENRKAGLATILCQPTDQTVRQGGKVTFKVEAEGAELYFRWFFEGGKDKLPQPLDADGKQLQFILTNAIQEGAYWCLIDSMGPLGQMQTRTRSAYLTMRPTILEIVPEPAPLRPGAAGSSPCEKPFCGWVYFNNYNAGYKPTDAAYRICETTLSKDPLGGSPIDTNAYDLYFRYGGGTGQCGCLTNLSATQKSFYLPVISPYGFTAYIHNGCPPVGTKYYLSVTFVKP